MRKCNQEIVNCLSECGEFDESCRRDGVGIPAFVIAETMHLIEGWCCGHPCADADSASIEKQV